jgi:hypothetical protein
MASVDVIDANGERLNLMNVTQGVGPHYGTEDDVMLVKALLSVVLGAWGHPDSTLPEATSGTLDEQTKKNIKIYRQKFNDNCKTGKLAARLTVDGRVSRARGYYSWDRNHPWTICTLNTEAGLCARMNGFKNAAHLVITAYPHLAKILKIDPNTF